MLPPVNLPCQRHVVTLAVFAARCCEQPYIVKLLKSTNVTTTLSSPFIRREEGEEVQVTIGCLQEDADVDVHGAIGERKCS